MRASRAAHRRGAALSTIRDAAIGADTITPVTTIACNAVACASDVYTSTVYVTLPSTDVGSAVASTRYTIDGSDPTLSSPIYSVRIPVTSTTTIKFRSWDNAGNVEATNTQLIQANLPPDTTPPTTTIACDGSACTDTGYNGSTTVSLTATDTGGWGVDKTYYTTDGSTPTTASTVYTVPVKLGTPGTYTVQFFSTDLAGNTEQVQCAANHRTAAARRGVADLRRRPAERVRPRISACPAATPRGRHVLHQQRHHRRGLKLDLAGTHRAEQQRRRDRRPHDRPHQPEDHDRHRHEDV